MSARDPHRIAPRAARRVWVTSALVFMLSWALPAGRGVAQDAGCVRVDLSSAASLDGVRVMARIGELTQRCVVDEGPHREVLTITLRARSERARVELASEGREPQARTVHLPDDAGERAETIAILASNLLADEAAELLALLRPTEVLVGTDATVGEGPATNDAATEVATEEPPAEVSDTPDVIEPDPANATEAAAALPEPESPAATIEATPLEEEEEPEAPAIPFLRLGAGAEIGSVPQGAGIDVDVLYGLELAWTAPSLLAVGLRHIGASSTPGHDDVTHIDLAPFAELSFTEAFFSGYGQLGAHLQLQVSGAGATFGVAPVVTAGVRFRLADVFSIGIETTLRLPVTDRFFTSLHALPALSLPWTGGLTLLFHVS